VDVVILTIVDGQLMVLLVERGDAPFKGCWALPGGFKRVDETLLHAAQRELTEETGLVGDAVSHLRQLGAYGDPGRDERGNIVTVAFTTVTPNVGPLAAGTDAAAAALRPMSAVLDNELDVAFDHGQILRDAYDKVCTDLESTDLAIRFINTPFTLTELRTVFEAVWRVELDPANFRRSLLTADDEWIEPTGIKTPTNGARGRPAERFVATGRWQHGNPLRRPQRDGRPDV